MCICVAVLLSALATAAMPASASATSPILEFVPSGSGFPISFEAEGGEVTAAMTGFDTVVHCTGSEGEGEITGPRSTISNYFFTGCKTQGGSAGGAKCKSETANEEEITSGPIEADLVFIDQATHEVGMVLNPHGGVYLEFECGGESVKAIGSFLSPVGPINKVSSSFTATLSRLGDEQTPTKYETVNGEKLQAIPTGEREGHPAANTGVELGFTINPSAPLEIKAVSKEEIEAKQHAEEEAAAKKRQEEEAKKHQEEAAKKRQEEEAARKRAQHRAKALKHCRRANSRHKRIKCERRVKRKYDTPGAPSKYIAPGRVSLAAKLSVVGAQSGHPVGHGHGRGRLGKPRDTVPAVKRSRALTSMIASRMAFGVAIWTLPGPVGKAFGVDMTRDPLAIYLSRLMGARDVALAWELLVTEGDAQRKWLIACMVCDVADTLAAAAAGRNGLPKRTTAMLLGASLGPLVRGAFVLRQR